MKKKYIFYFLGFLSMIFIFYLFLLFLSTRHPDPNAVLSHERIFNETGVNLYNADTVLSEVRNGEAEVFSDTELGPGLNLPEDYVDSINFTDEELFEIGQYFLRTQWDEDTDDWRLVKVVYSLYNCEKGFLGPYSVGFFFQKKVRINWKTYVDERSIRIDVWKGMIVWNDKVEERNNLSSAINWEHIYYHAMDAYKIAEENGGAEIHSVPESKCEDVIIYLYDNDEGWRIDYNDHLGHDLLELKIDTKTGEVKE